MIDQRPESLLWKDSLYSRTPVMVAFENGPSTPFMVNLLKDLVLQCPDSIRLTGDAYSIALFIACLKFPDRELLELLVRVDPLALCLADSYDLSVSPLSLQLPYEAAAEQEATSVGTVGFLNDHTARVAAAGVEYALAAGPAGRLGEFKLRVAAVVANALPSIDLAKTSAFVVTQALRNSSGCMDMCRALFAQEKARWWRKGGLEVLLGESVLGLYRMGLLGDRSSPLPDRQVRLLACVADNLDCLFLQLRECAAVALVDARAAPRRARVRTPRERSPRFFNRSRRQRRRIARRPRCRRRSGRALAPFRIKMRPLREL
jgi:hypothetical protein